MQSITIGANEAGQRMDKFLSKYLKEAGRGFIYKMLRNKKRKKVRRVGDSGRRRRDKAVSFRRDHHPVFRHRGRVGGR